MRLDKEIVIQGLCESRKEAQELIEKGKVLVNSVVVIKQNKDIKAGDIISLLERRKYVSRGGEKLEGVFNDIYKDTVQSFLQRKVALDVGSSTGGFTDFLLQNGVFHVDCVDVGTSQLHESLRKNTKISLYENTDIRSFQKEKDYDVIVADLSFISLEDVIENLHDLGTPMKTKYFILLKPQFEVGKGKTKKGIVRDLNLIEEIQEKIKNMLFNKGFSEISILPCKIVGGDGNQEYFIVAEI